MSKRNDRLYITRSAMDKILAYARIACKELSDAECLGYLTSGCEEAEIIDGALLAPDQKAGSSWVKVGGASVLRAARELERLGCRPRGWFHSHGTMEPFHSATDDHNSELVSDQMFSANRTSNEMMDIPATVTREMGQLVISGGGIRITIEQEASTKNDGGDSQEVVRLSIERPRSRIFSLVVNGKGAPPYARISIRTYCPLCNSASTEERRIDVHVIEEARFTEESIRKEVRERINAPADRPLSSERASSFPDSSGLNSIPPILKGDSWL